VVILGLVELGPGSLLSLKYPARVLHNFLYVCTLNLNQFLS